MFVEVTAHEVIAIGAGQLLQIWTWLWTTLSLKASIGDILMKGQSRCYLSSWGRLMEAVSLQ